MNLTFCDLCNESIPQADLDEGRAVRRNERWICAACEAAMSTSRPAPLPDIPPPAPLAPRVVPAPAPAPAAPSALLAVALVFAGVALVAAVGTAAYLLVQMDRTRDALEQRIESVERSSFERERALAASVEGSAADRGSELEAAREELRTLEARLQTAEQQASATSTLARRVEALEQGGGSAPEGSAQQALEISALREAVAELQRATSAADAASADEVEQPARSSGDEQEPVETASAPETPADGEPPAWQSWLGDLASQDSGTRWQAVSSLGGTRDERVVPHLVPVLEDADIFVRMAAARVLGDLGSPAAIPALIEALGDDEANVRDAVYSSLKKVSKQNIPFDPFARDAERQKRIKAWRDWWEQSGKKLLDDKKTRG